MRGETFRWFVVLSLVPFVMVLGNSMLIPVLPAIKSHLDLTPVQTGLVITAFSLPAAVTIPFAGALSDRVGRKVVMVPALLLYGLGGILAGLGTWLLPGRFWPLIGARILQGIGAGGTYQLALALAGDVFQSAERARAVGYLEASNGIGKVASPLLGALAAMVVWFLPFFVYGAVAIPAALGVLAVVPEPKRQRKAQGLREYLASLGAIARQRGAALAAGYGAGMLALSALFGVLSLVSDELESRFALGQLARGGIIAIPVGVMAAVAFAGGLYLQRRPVHLKAVAVVGLVLGAVALGTLALVRQPLWAVVALSAVLGLGTGLTLPAVNVLVTSAAARQQRGAVTALYGTVRFGGVALGPPLFGLAVEPGPRLVILGLTALAAAGLACAMAIIRPPGVGESTRARSEETDAQATGGGPTPEPQGAPAQPDPG
ncbi:MFS transporter [Geochorda subterranea]|uniref:MFS transporter n=1 Tax=Geochorda subterranea TaxID=3109564 RepID=A0ABZ1BLE3_9FIRM|nr:MFS transporter [Limnochorda sp. LNt]WRP13647.1 MFS transporter [Limnochorda sp. LNt]